MNLCNELEIVDYIRESASAEKLFKFLAYEKIEVQAETLNLLLTICDAPKSLNRLYLGLEVLPDVFIAVVRGCREVEQRWFHKCIEKCSSLLSILLDNRQQISAAFPEFEKRDLTARNNSLSRLVANNPLFAFLGTMTYERETWNRYTNLKAQVLMAYMVLRARTNFNRDLIYRGIEAARGLSALEANADLIKLDDGPVSTRTFAGKILTLSGGDSGGHLYSLLQTSLFAPKNHKLTKVPPTLEVDIPVGPEPEVLNPPGAVELSEKGLDDQTERLKKAIIQEAGEIPASFDLYLSDSSFNAEHAAKRISKDNQLFAFDCVELTNDDVANLLIMISPNLRNNGTSISDVFTNACLNLMFWVGLKIKDIRHLKVSFFAPPTADLTYCYPQGVIRLRSKGPKLNKKTYALKTRYPKQEYIDLILPECARFALNRACEVRFPSFARLAPHQLPSTALISTVTALDFILIDGNTLRIQCQKVIARLKRRGFYRFTLHRIRNYHFRRLTRMPFADVCTSALTLGRDESLAKVKIHYLASDSVDLANIFRLSANEILHEAEVWEPKPKISATNQLHLGTPFRLYPDAIIRTVRLLKDALEKAREKASSPEGIIHFHNLFTAYTVFLVSWSTGHRRSGLPVIPYSAWDQDTGFAICRDKDTADFYHTRLLWLTPDCQKQLLEYRKHLQTLGIPLQSVNQDKDQEFFFLKSRTVKNTNPAALYQILKDHEYDYEGHPQRHFAKSRLQEMGCAPVVIELFLGHWALGLEGWVRTSGLHPFDYRKELRRFLPELIQSLELTPVGGLKRKPPRIKFSLSPKTRKKTKKKILPEHPPGQIWFDMRRSGCRENASFSKNEETALVLLYQYFPDLYHGQPDAKINESKLDEFMKKLLERNRPVGAIYSRYRFIRHGFKKGMEPPLNWDLKLPPEIKILKKETNRLRPDMIRKLGLCRELESSFLDSLKDPLPQNNSLCIAQILLSSLLYGGILHEEWLQALLDGLFIWDGRSRIFQWENKLWINLWRNRGLDAVPGTREYFQAQSKPNEFRRWFSDPLTQLLIMRWLTKRPEQRLVRLRRKPFVILQELLSMLQKKGRHDRYNKRKFTLEIKSLRQLFFLARSRCTVTIPPFMAAYAENNLESASLPDEIFMRTVTGQHFPISHRRREKGNHKRFPLSIEYDQNAQYVHYRKIRGVISQRKEDGSQQLKKDQIRTALSAYLATHKETLSPILCLLGAWAVQLLSKKIDQRERRKKKAALAPISVFQYLGHISEPLIDACKLLDPLEFDTDDYVVIYKQVITTMREGFELDNGEGENFHSRIVNLNQFHGFLVAFYNQPDIDIENLDRGYHQISCNYVSVPQYQLVCKRLGWGSEDLNRYELMTLVATIISYRTGLRKEEIHGLIMNDVKLGPSMTDLLVHPNRYRKKLKSTSAIRRLPLNVLLTDKELKLIHQWVRIRRVEPGSKGTTPLFTDSAVTSRLVSDRHLFDPLRKALKEVLNDESVVVHHLRDSFLQNHSLKLFLRNDIPNVKVPAFLMVKEFSEDYRMSYEQGLFPNDFPGVKKLFSGAVLLGHADIYEGFRSYFHLADWLLGYYTCHHEHLPRLSAGALAQISGLKKSRCYEIKDDTNVLLDLAHSCSKNNNLELGSPIEQQERTPLQFSSLVNESQTVNNKLDCLTLPSFDAALSQAILTSENPLAIKISEQLQFLRNKTVLFALTKQFYEFLRQVPKGDLTNLQRQTQQVVDAFVEYGNYFQVNEPKDFQKFIVFLESLEISANAYTVTYHASRYLVETRKIKAIKKFNKKLTSEDLGPDCQIEGTISCARIHLSPAWVTGHSLSYDLYAPILLCCRLICFSISCSCSKERT